MLSPPVPSSPSDNPARHRWPSAPIALAVGAVLLIAVVTGASLGRGRLAVAPSINVGLGVRAAPASSAPSPGPASRATARPGRRPLDTVPSPTTDERDGSTSSVPETTRPTTASNSGAGVYAAQSPPTTLAPSGGETEDPQIPVTAVKADYPIITTPGDAE